MGANSWIGSIMGANRTKKKKNLTKWSKSKRKKYKKNQIWCYEWWWKAHNIRKIILPVFQSIFCYFHHGNIFQFHAKGSQADFKYSYNYVANSTTYSIDFLAARLKLCCLKLLAQTKVSTEMSTVGSTHILTDGRCDLWGLSPSLHFSILSFLNSVVLARIWMQKHWVKNYCLKLN